MGAHPTIMGPEMGFTVPPILAAIPCENKMTELQGRLFLRTHLSNPLKKKNVSGLESERHVLKEKAVAHPECVQDLA
jgi:hypothetical protein